MFSWPSTDVSERKMNSFYPPNVYTTRAAQGPRARRKHPVITMRRPKPAWISTSPTWTPTRPSIVNPTYNSPIHNSPTWCLNSNLMNPRRPSASGSHPRTYFFPKWRYYFLLSKRTPGTGFSWKGSGKNRTMTQWNRPYSAIWPIRGSQREWLISTNTDGSLEVRYLSRYRPAGHPCGGHEGPILIWRPRVSGFNLLHSLSLPSVTTSPPETTGTLRVSGSSSRQIIPSS